MNQSGSAVGHNFEQSVMQIEGVKIREVDATSIQTDLIMSKYVAVIEFQGEQNYVIHSIDNRLEPVIQGIVGEYVSSGELKGLTEILQEMESASISVAQRGVGFILLTLIVTSVLTACSFIKDQQDGILRRYKLTPHPTNTYITANFVFNFAMSLLQIMVSILLICQYAE